MGMLSTPAARDFAYSGIEHEDEVYSVRQLAAHDSSADLVKVERPLPVLVPTGGGAVSTTDSSQVSLNDEEETLSEESAVGDETTSDDRPFAVTASVFCSADEKGGCKDDSRKDSLPKHVQEEKAFVQTLKESLEESIKESLKENNEPEAVDRQSFIKKTPFVFQVWLMLSIYQRWIFSFWIGILQTFLKDSKNIRAILFKLVSQIV